MKARGGIDLGGTKIQAVVVDDGGTVIGSARSATPTSGGPPGVMRAMAETLRSAASAADVETKALAGVGVGSPGDVDAAKGTVAEARNLPGWEHAYPLADELGKALGTRVAIGNDVHVAIDAEYRLGAGKGFSSLIGLFWGTGVGGALILDSKPWQGRGAAGEIGHMVVKNGGAKCTCGRRGCLEAYAGRAAMEIKARREAEKGKKTKLFEIMEKRGRDRLTSGVWERALDEGDKLAAKLLDRAVDAIAVGLASAVNLLDVEAVLIGGGLGDRLGPRYLDAIRAAMLPHLFVDDRPPVVELTRLADLGGAIGAALLVEPPQRRSPSRQRRDTDGGRPAASARARKRT
jgi:glucokinase